MRKQPEIVACVITHLPELKGYHAKRLEVVQCCLETMRHNAGRSVDVYVWDNGSGPELRNWLLNEYKPDYLTLSPNIGKSSARCALMRTFNVNTILNISDDDMYYYPGWLEPQLELLRGFPNAAQVSGYPVRTQFRWATATTLEWARNNPDATIESGHFISEREDRDFCISIGRDYNWHVDNTIRKGDIEHRITYNGLQAYATAHHCQFMTIAGRLEYIVEWNNEATADERPFDKVVDSEGYLRLTTTQRYTRHIGNILDDELRQEWQAITVPNRK